MAGAAVGNLIDVPSASLIGHKAAEAIVLEEEYLNGTNYTPSDDPSPSLDHETENATAPNSLTPEAPELDHKEVHIKRGQGMMDILVNSGAERTDAFKAITALSKHYNMKKLQIGQTLQASYDSDGRLTELNMRKNFGE